MNSKIIKSALAAVLVAFMAAGCNMPQNNTGQPIDIDPNSNSHPSTDMPQTSVLEARR